MNHKCFIYPKPRGVDRGGALRCPWRCRCCMGSDAPSALPLTIVLVVVTGSRCACCAGVDGDQLH
ncbi:MAG: hypothetical protein ACLUS6_03765 [Dysosmobacter sp.]